MSRAQDTSEATRGADPEPGPARPLARRARLPNGRAVTGALLVSLAIVGLFVAQRRSSAGAESSYVVLAERVERGGLIDASALTTRNMDLAPDVADLVVTEPSEAVGSVAAETLLPGQLLQFQALVDSQLGQSTQTELFELSFEIDRSRALAGTLRPGEHVDVVATLRTGGEVCTHVVASAARVVESVAVSDGVGSGGRRLTLTLALAEPHDALGAVLAVDEADATIVRSIGSERRSLSGALCEHGLGTAVEEAANGS